jgi:hypothetical protein
LAQCINWIQMADNVLWSVYSQFWIYQNDYTDFTVTNQLNFQVHDLIC